MLQHRGQFPCIHVKEHHLLEAVAGYPVILRKDKEIFNTRVMGQEEVLLQLRPALVPCGGLIDGLEPVLIQEMAGRDAVSHDPLYIQLRDSHAVHAAPDQLQAPDERLRASIDRRLDLRGDDKPLFIQGFF